MEYNELIDAFAKRHKVENLVAVDGAAALDIDGIIVNIVAKGELLNFSAEIGEPPADGAALFANLLLEANTQPDAFFAKIGVPVKPKIWRFLNALAISLCISPN